MTPGDGVLRSGTGRSCRSPGWLETRIRAPFGQSVFAVASPGGMT